MSPWLLLILIIVGNLVIYWIFYGRRKFEEKLELARRSDTDGLEK